MIIAFYIWPYGECNSFNSIGWCKPAAYPFLYSYSALPYMDLSPAVLLLFRLRQLRLIPVIMLYPHITVLLIDLLCVPFDSPLAPPVSVGFHFSINICCCIQTPSWAAPTISQQPRTTSVTPLGPLHASVCLRWL